MLEYEDRYRSLQPLAWLVRILYMIPMAVVYLLVYLLRRIGRRYVQGRAETWPKVTALISGSYEIDENQSVLSRNGWGLDADDDNYYPRFAVALEYSYRAGAEIHGGTYFLPNTYTEGDRAGEMERAWAGRKIIVRYNPNKPAQSVFLEEDGAPGKPHIPRLISYRRYLTDLSLK